MTHVPVLSSENIVAVDFPIDGTAWSEWLSERLLDQWRLDEWRSDVWLFRGDLYSDATCTWPCAVANCGIGVVTRSGFRNNCKADFAVSTLTKQEFAQTHQAKSDRRAPMRAIACLVIRGESACARSATIRGLCATHRSAWRSYSIRHPHVVCEQWCRTVAEPLPPLPICLVLGCDTEIGSGIGLCPGHRTRWRKDARAGRAAETAEGWAARQAPWLSTADFSLAPLNPAVRVEVLYALQQRDLRGVRMDPGTMRRLVRAWQTVDSLLGLDPDDCPVSGPNAQSQWQELVAWVKGAFDQFRGIDAGAVTELNLMTAGIRSHLTKSGRRARASDTVNLSGLRQHWLRGLLLEWVRLKSPVSIDFRQTLKACTLASQVLTTRPGGGHDPAGLRVPDMDAVVDAFGSASKNDGSLYSYTTRSAFRRLFFNLLEFGRREELVADLSPRFAAHAHHTIPRIDEDEDDAAKAIPEYVIRQLDDQLDSFGRDNPRFPQCGLSDVDLMWMVQTAYIVMRDTGRRPRELCGLKIDCLKYEAGDYHLIWDNFKKKRMRRLLPITKQTAAAIESWQRRRRELTVTPASADHLFPAATSDKKYPHMDSGDYSRALRYWVDSLPAIDSDRPGQDGSPLPFDRSRIFPYAFRSAFAQRHADAGTDIDVLMALMDHRSPDVTMGYYRVSMDRKREAVSTLRLHSVDRTGKSAPFSSDLSYESKSVAVPYGNCIEPSNVKAGGKKCAIRFQCAGCGFYRPDPSYLLAIQDHIRALKADRELAHAMDADTFVIRNLTDQIQAFDAVVERMNNQMAQLPPEVQAEINDASTVLRKVRAGGRTMLPLSVVERPDRSR